MLKLDQFYTNPKISSMLFKKLKKFSLENYFLFEPSAGEGAFFNLFHKNSLGIDLEPKTNNIIKKNFLELNISMFDSKKVFTIGNPPFGQNSSLAIKFFNKAAIFSEYIAFIVPKTFKKDSVINKLDNNMHLIEEIELKGKCFYFNNKEKKVKTIFQIWKKKSFKREKIEIRKKTKDFYFVKKEENPDFAIRRVGDLSGKILKNFNKYSKNSHLYIKINENKIKKAIFYNRIKKIYKILNEHSKYVAGTPSISKNEIIKIYEKKYN